MGQVLAQTACVRNQLADCFTVRLAKHICEDWSSLVSRPLSAVVCVGARRSPLFRAENNRSFQYCRRSLTVAVIRDTAVKPVKNFQPSNARINLNQFIWGLPLENQTATISKFLNGHSKVCLIDWNETIPNFDTNGTFGVRQESMRHDNFEGLHQNHPNSHGVFMGLEHQ